MGSTFPTSDGTVVIAGGGIAGLAAALACAREGFRVRVCEQVRSFEEVGAGIQLGPNALRALEALGAFDHVAPRLFAPEAIDIRCGVSGASLVSVPLGAPFEQRFGAPYRVAHRADLLAGLVAACRTEPLITLETGASVQGFGQENGHVRVAFAGLLFPLRAAALIGADGVHSTVRQLLLSDGPPDYSGHVIYRALIPRSDAPAAAMRDAVTLWLCPGGHVVHYPVGAGEKLNIVAAFDSAWREDGWSAPGEPRVLAEAFSGVCRPLLGVLSTPGQWFKWAGADRPPAPLWTRNRVTLVGDAAHPVLPYLAQGAAMALEDAVALGRALKAQRLDLPAAFQAYEAERRPRTARMRIECRRAGAAYHAQGIMRLARNIVLRLMTPERSYGRMSWIYGWR